jgi:hypothetical protein
VHGRVRDMAFTLDRKSKKVVMPTVMGDQAIHSGVNRNLKHITVITCVAASGEHVIPLFRPRNQMTSGKC